MQLVVDFQMCLYRRLFPHLEFKLMWFLGGRFWPILDVRAILGGVEVVDSRRCFSDFDEWDLGQDSVSTES